MRAKRGQEYLQETQRRYFDIQGPVDRIHETVQLRIRNVPHSFGPMERQLSSGAGWGLRVLRQQVAENMLYLVCAGYDLDKLSDSAEISKWCGCHLKKSLYGDYMNRYGVRPECTPACTIERAIKE